MTLTEYRFSPAARYPEHHHPQEQLSVVVDGAATFVVDGEAYRMSVGDVVVVPPSVPHEVSAGDGGARLLSVVAPGRRGGDRISLVEEGG
jgi:quercetin dioxygenase-like cupin family protein